MQNHASPCYFVLLSHYLFINKCLSISASYGYITKTFRAIDKRFWSIFIPARPLCPHYMVRSRWCDYRSTCKLFFRHIPWRFFPAKLISRQWEFFGSFLGVLCDILKTADNRNIPSCKGFAGLVPPKYPILLFSFLWEFSPTAGHYREE